MIFRNENVTDTALCEAPDMVANASKQEGGVVQQGYTTHGALRVSDGDSPKRSLYSVENFPS